MSLSSRPLADHSLLDPPAPLAYLVQADYKPLTFINIFPSIYTVYVGGWVGESFFVWLDWTGVVLLTGCWAGNHSSLVLYLTSRGQCVSSSGTSLLAPKDKGLY